MFAKAVSKKDCNIAYIAPTYQQSRDIAWQELKKVCQQLSLNINESRLEITLETVGGGKSVISLRGWEAIETLRGQKFDFIVIDEVAMMRNFWTNWQEVIRPTLTDTRGEVMFISTPKGFNHFYELFNLELKDRDYRSFKFTSYDNPYLPKDEIDKAKEELTEDRFGQEYMADFRKTEGLVYKEFDRTKHLFDDLEIPRVKDTFAGIDFGFTNPAAIITIKRDSDDNYWVMPEWYKTGQTDAQIAEYASGLSLNYCYPDPESPSGIKELKNHGLNIREVVKNKDSIKNGINRIRELLKANKLKIYKGNENLIWEFETYSYPEKKDMRNEEENPIKENDHALDALRYALSMVSGLTLDNKAKVFTPSNLNRTAIYRPNLTHN